VAETRRWVVVAEWRRPAVLALPGLPRAPSLQVFSKSGLRVLLLLLGSLAPTFELETLSLALELKTRRAAIALPRPLPYSGSATVRRRHHLIMP